MTVSAWIIDGALVLIFLAAAAWAAYKGFFVTVLRLAAWVVSFGLAAALSAALAAPVYEAFFASPARELIAQNIGAAVDGSQAAQYAQQVIADLPGAVQELAEVAGISINELVGGLQTGLHAENAAIVLEQGLVAPIATAVIRLVISLVLFVILMVVLRFVCSWLEKLRKLPVLKQADWLLGAVLGAVKGLLLVFVLALVLQAAAALSADDGAFVQAVSNSRIVSFMHK